MADEHESPPNRGGPESLTDDRHRAALLRKASGLAHTCIL